MGRFRFEAVPTGTYTLRAKTDGFSEAKEGPFVLSAGDTKSITLHLTKARPAQEKDSASAIEFSDEPRFTVAGITDTTTLGGHGSDRVLRNSDALSKDAASLAREASSRSAHEPPVEANEAALRARLAEKETADLHFQLAELEESRVRPLDAVKDYQRAAELQPIENYLFAWAAELLLHRAFEPASEVFAKGQRLYPRSIRMRLGLGAALYAQGFRQEAAKTFLDASDLDPSDATPYLFLGRLEAVETDLLPGSTEKMKRFVSLHPESGMAHYLYAVALAKQGGEQQNSATVESQLQTAVELDPHLGDAYLQLGIYRSRRQDFPGAIAAFQKAIETTPLPDQAHYRLAEVYRQMGNTEKATTETALFKQISEQKKTEADRERHEIQQFVYTLRDQPTAPKTTPPNPH
jgi:tetratricopeptide (TPR) repeat protein